MTIEVLIPVRNPTEVFFKTIESLAAQTDKNFSVLISDNFSIKGAEHFESALQKLAAAGISAKKIQPPSELGRVEHWNWIHQQSQADWLKPLFAGDWLELDYISSVRDIIRGESACGYIYCGFQHHHGAETWTVISHWNGKFFSAHEMQNVVMRYGMQFGPPSAAIYKRELFIQSGGYDSSLPICADALLFCKLAARHGAFGISSVKTHFVIHAARFSDQLPNKRRELFREQMRYMIELGRLGWQERWSFPLFGYLRFFGREIFNHYKSQ